MQTRRAGFVLLLLALVSSGCVPMCYNCYDGRFDGIRARVQQAGATGAVHIVMIHGMTEHRPGYSDIFADGIASRLRFTNNGNVATNHLPLPVANAVNVLRDFSYSCGPTQLFFHELTWSPTTQPLKDGAFSLDHSAEARRLRLNATLKRGIIDDGFGDAVLYLNPTFQRNMQEPILQTIRHVVQCAGSNDTIMLVSASLGSKMTFDAIERWTTDGSDDFLEKTSDIIMLANQVPLINLGVVSITNGAPAVQDTALKKFLQRSAQQKQIKIQRQKIRGRNGSPSTNKVIHVVAATDPNDLLSYPLRAQDVLPPASTNEVEVTLANIYSHNAWGVPWIVESPLPAHTAYDQNGWLLDRLVEGFKAKTERRCFTDTVTKTPLPPKGAKHF